MIGNILLILNEENAKVEKASSILCVDDTSTHKSYTFPTSFSSVFARLYGVFINVISAFIPNRRIRHKFREDLKIKLALQEQKKIPVPDPKNIPIYIISYNRLSYIRLLTDFLEKRGFQNIHIIDNQSSYPPLLEYLKTSKHQVHYMNKNYGHMVFWESGKFDDVAKNQYYVISDPDILPTDECPNDFMNVFLRLLQEYPEVTKVGFALKVDDLPEHYSVLKRAIELERQKYPPEIRLKDKEGAREFYQAPLDTTFALYRPSKSRVSKDFYKAVHVGGEYVARHLPWYSTPDNFTEEDLFYIRTAGKSSNWSQYAKKGSR